MIYNIDEVKQFEEWIVLKCSKILFDSNIDNCSKDTSVFNEKKIIRKKQLVFFLIEDNYKFGYYLRTKVIGECRSRNKL